MGPAGRNPAQIRNGYDGNGRGPSPVQRQHSDRCKGCTSLVFSGLSSCHGRTPSKPNPHKQVGQLQGPSYLVRRVSRGPPHNQLISHKKGRLASAGHGMSSEQCTPSRNSLASPTPRIVPFMGLEPSPSPSGDRLKVPDCSPAPFDGTAKKVPRMVSLLGTPKPRHLWVVFRDSEETVDFPRRRPLR